MSKDGDSCAALRLEQQRRRRAAIRAARRAAAAAAGQPYESAPPSPVRRGGGGAAGAGADAIPDASADADSEETAVVAGEASSASAAAGGGAAAGGPGELSLAPSGGLAGGASGFGDAGVEEEHEEEQEEEEEGLDEDPAFVVASGRLAQLMGLTTAHGGLGGHSLGAGGDVVAGIELAPQVGWGGDAGAACAGCGVGYGDQVGALWLRRAQFHNVGTWACKASGRGLCGTSGCKCTVQRL